MRTRHVAGAAAVTAALVASGCSAAPVPPGWSASPTAASVVPVAPASTAAPGETDPPTARTSATPGPGAPGTPTPPAASTLEASPPAAALQGLDGGAPVPGDLGSYTWDGFASDGPWVVGPASRAAAGAGVQVSFAGGSAPVSWAAAWAPLRNGAPGTPIAGGSGRDGPATIVPARPGEWSLRISATFGEGRQAAWYWHLAVAP